MPARDTAAEVASIARVVEATWRIEAAKIVATLTRYVGDFGLAEDLAQDALAAAMSEWPRSGVPAYPAAWLTTTAKRRAIDGWRRRENFEKRIPLLADEQRVIEGVEATELPWNPDVIEDDVLRLVFISCHPVLSRASSAPAGIARSSGSEIVPSQRHANRGPDDLPRAGEANRAPTLCRPRLPRAMRLPRVSS